MILWTAFLLGLVGSLHCAGMCGPLALAVPVLGQSKPAVVLSRLIFNLGRITTYVLIGLLFGLIGETFVLAGFQRWLSLIAGGVILTGLLLTSRFSVGVPVTRTVGRLKGAFGGLLHKRSVGALFALGLLNGLLPCGLVYVAAAAALAAGSIPMSGAYMAAFGLGTVPMMFGFGVVGMQLQQMLRFRLQRMVPFSVVLVAVLLLLRGMALGIPYLSPAPAESGEVCPMCADAVPAEAGSSMGHH